MPSIGAGIGLVLRPSRCSVTGDAIVVHSSSLIRPASSGKGVSAKWSDSTIRWVGL